MSDDMMWREEDDPDELAAAVAAQMRVEWTWGGNEWHGGGSCTAADFRRAKNRGYRFRVPARWAPDPGHPKSFEHTNELREQEHMSESDASGYSANIVDGLAAELAKRAAEAHKLASIAYEQAAEAQNEGDRFQEIGDRLTNAVSALRVTSTTECVAVKASVR